MGKGSWAASPPSPGSSINAINEHTYTAKAAFPRSQQRPEGNLYQIGTGAAMVYDSFGRRVEQSGAEILYGPDGSKLALMSGQSVTRAFAPLPGAPTLGAGLPPAWDFSPTLACPITSAAVAWSCRPAARRAHRT